MDLNLIWFILITVLFIGFFFLEGFDFGVGILYPFLGKTDGERRSLIQSIAPFWDGNEVWLVTAGGAMFAAFPHWYATLFSGFYLALFLLLAAVILRGLAIELRSKDPHPLWRLTWDWAFFASSLLLALLWGVAMSNLLRGVPINPSMQFVGNLGHLLNFYALTGGLTFLLLFTFHGALFLTLKMEDPLMERARLAALGVGALALGVASLYILLTYGQTDLFDSIGAGTLLWTAQGVLTAAYGLAYCRSYGWAFAGSSLAILLLTGSLFWGLFPRVMVSSLAPEWSLTIYNASASPYTLKLLTIVALVMLPVVLLYEAWSYWVFRHRIKMDSPDY